MAKSKLIANQSPHAVALSGDGLASRRKSGNKSKKAAVDAEPVVATTPALAPPLRPTRRPVDRAAPPPAPAAVPVPAPAAEPPVVAVVARKPSTRKSTPKGPSLSPAVQERMRAMAERLHTVRSHLADIEAKQRKPGARRRTP